MKKIMFNERYGLQQASFDGSKTMTRRIVPDKIKKDAFVYQSHHIDDDRAYERYILEHAPYKVGEIVAVAQRYSQLVEEIESLIERLGLPFIVKEEIRKHKGWDNKMYVRAEDMPRRIKITGLRVEGLAGISDEDCLKEGITHVPVGINHFGVRDLMKGVTYYYYTPYLAYKGLIDSLNKRGFFESNPLVYAYSYEMVEW
ncbi:MAG: hypothetical protein IJS13_03960 [Paludibacteraceae bacterium]|nr:hypothetical protein [Paludibacteraceae bacterium]